MDHPRDLLILMACTLTLSDSRLSLSNQGVAKLREGDQGLVVICGGWISYHTALHPIFKARQIPHQVISLQLFLKPL
jgi:hypothetical protein